MIAVEIQKRHRLNFLKWMHINLNERFSSYSFCCVPHIVSHNNTSMSDVFLKHLYQPVRYMFQTSIPSCQLCVSYTYISMSSRYSKHLYQYLSFMFQTFIPVCQLRFTNTYTSMSAVSYKHLYQYVRYAVLPLILAW